MSKKNPNIPSGWNMTNAQIYGDGRNGSQPGYFEMFRQICVAKGWKGNGEQMSAHRREWHVMAGLGPVSAKDIDRMRGFDALKAQWLAICKPDDLNAQMKVADQPRHRLITRIRSMAHADYIQGLLESSRFNARELEELNEAELEQFRNTLEARVRSHHTEEKPEDEMVPF